MELRWEQTLQQYELDPDVHAKTIRELNERGWGEEYLAYMDERRDGTERTNTTVDGFYDWFALHDNAYISENSNHPSDLGSKKLRFFMALYRYMEFVGDYISDPVNRRIKSTIRARGRLVFR